jgi:peroxiredoxin
VSGEELGNFDVAVYAASVDPPDKNEAFAKELGIDYPILSDPTKETAKAFGVLMPGKEVAARWTFIIGKNGKVLDVMRDVDPSTHGKDVAARLAALGIPKKDSASSPSASAAPSASASLAPSASAKPSAKPAH